MPTAASSERDIGAPFGQIAAMLICVQIIFALQDSFVKLVSADLAAWQITTLRSAFTLCFLLAAARFSPRLARPVKNRAAVIARSLCQAASMLLYIVAIARLPLAISAVCFYTFPILSTLLSALVARARVGLNTWIAVLLGFVGAALVVGPAWEAHSAAVVFPLLGALAYAVSVIITHYGCGDESVGGLLRTQHLTLLGVGLAMQIGGALDLAPAADWSQLALWQVGAFLGLAAINLLSGMMLAHVYQSAAPPRLAPFSYSYLAFAALVDTVLWGHPPTATTLIGGALTAVAGVIALRSQSSRNRRFNQPLR